MADGDVDYRETFSQEMQTALEGVDTVENLASGYIELKNAAGQDYREGFSDEMKTALDKFDSPEKLANGYIELEKHASRLKNEKGLVVPGENATSEQIAEFNRGIGVPDAPDGYELDVPEFPEGMIYNEERANKFSALAHSVGIPKAAFQALVKAFNEDQVAEFEAQATAGKDFREKSTAEMKKEWGVDYGVNLARADSVISPIFGDEFKQLLTDTGFNNHPAVIKGLFKVATIVGEHALVLGDGKRQDVGPLTDAKLREMTDDPRYYDPSRRNNDYVKGVEEYADALAKQKNPGANANP